MFLLKKIGTLWNVDLNFTIVKVNTEFATLDNDAISGVEDIAYSLSFSEASVGNVSMNRPINLVSEGNNELTTGVDVELIIDPFLLEGVFNNFLCLSCSVDGLSEDIDIMLLIEILEQDFSVHGVVTSTVALLGTIVVEGNTSASKREGKSRLE